MTTQSEQKDEFQRHQRTASLAVPLPIRDGNLFKHSATADILHLLSQYPFAEYTHRELARRTDHNVNSIRSAVSVLEANDVVTISQDGNAQPVSINRTQLYLPENPVLSVPQEEFQLPVQIAIETIHTELTDVSGILLFGSVAEGTADRQSDIDLWVLVADDRLQEQQRANQLSKRLSETVFPNESELKASELEALTERSAETDPVALLPETEDGERFEFEILVETPTSIRNRADERIAEILTEGLVLYRTETLETVVDEVIEDAG